MNFNSIFASLSIAALSFIGCDRNPIDQTGGPSLPTSQSPVSENYSNPGPNPGLSGAAPHPEPRPGTMSPAAQPGEVIPAPTGEANSGAISGREVTPADQ